MQTFRGYINTAAADIKKEKLELSKKAQKYFIYHSGTHDDNANVCVYKLDESNCVVIDTDDKYTYEYIEKLIRECGVECVRTPSLSNALRHEEGENKYRYHYWFRSKTPLQKMLGINKTKLDFLTKELVFEHIDSKIDGLHEICPQFLERVFAIPNPDIQAVGPVLPVVSVPSAVEGGFIVESLVPISYIEAEKAWIDKNTKVVDARSYKPWSETLFKIHNKYNGNNIGRKIAHYFSQKDKDGYDADKVDYFWNKIRPEKIENCVFGLGVDERATMLNELFLSYQSEIISQTKNRNKKEKEMKKGCHDVQQESIIVYEPTDEAVGNAAFAILKKDFVYSRGQYFYKKNNLWCNDQTVFTSALRSAIMDLDILYPQQISEKKTIYIKYCAFITKANAVATFVKDCITMEADETFYDKLHSTVKGKLVFKDGVYNFKEKTFYKWDDEYLLKNPVFPIACIPRNYPDADSVTQEFKDKCIEKIYGLYTEKETKDLLHFMARAAAGHIEDKNWNQQTTNRDSGKSVQCDWIIATFGDSYVGTVDYSHFIVQQNAGDDAAKSNGWLMPFQFKRFMLISESKGDVTNTNFKIDGGKIKSLCSGGDVIEARSLFQNAVNIKIQCSPLIFNNDALPVTTTDVFEKCLQINGQCQFKSQEFIDAKMNAAVDNPALLDLCKRQYRLGDPDLKETVKTPEWTDALIRIIIDNYKTFAVTIEQNNEEENETTLNEMILQNYTITGSDDDFISNEELREDAKQFKSSLKKLKGGMQFIGKQCVREGMHMDEQGKRRKGIFGIKYIE